ncbi:hypothetical protein BJ166DRAFT_618143 [Pestalotiopsis sp. NC0098]|nr:hypothetical protein BJ166DRAFT_618143 [Pestalotiopsis sp. NC0098]
MWAISTPKQRTSGKTVYETLSEDAKKPKKRRREVQTAEVLQKYFDGSKKLDLEAYIGSGLFADVFRIKEAGGPANRVKRYVVKIPDTHGNEFYGNDVDYLDEAEALKHFRGAAHVVQPKYFLPHEDPLTKGKDELPVKEYMYMEWLENGTLGNFFKKIAEDNGVVPNRVLWHFLLCYVRIGIACAWPDVHDPKRPRLEEMQKGIPKYFLLNEDCHAGNMVFGDLASPNTSLDHDLVPIMKMIDLGLVEKVPTPNQKAWEKAMNRYMARVSEILGRAIEFCRDSRKNCPVDPDLKQLLTEMSETKGDKYPEFADVLRRTFEAVRDRRDGWYAKNQPKMETGIEESVYIRKFLQKYIFEAPDAARPIPVDDKEGEGGNELSDPIVVSAGEIDSWEMYG